MKSEIKYYDTFITNTGSLDQRIKTATGLSNAQSLRVAMGSKPKNVARDLLMENTCSQNCISCYFQEEGAKRVGGVRKPDVSKTEGMIQSLRTDDPDLFFFYPREISMAPELLPFYKKLGQDRVLTNGKLLHKNDLVDKLRAAGIKRMSVTVPGGREAFSYYTGEPPADYDQLLSNISLAVKSGFNVSIFTPVFSRNVDDIVPMTRALAERGVKEVQFLRVVPEGRAKELSDEDLLSPDGIAKFLRNLNSARHLVGDKMNLVLFKGYFGINFYQKKVFRYLSGQLDVWPKSEFFCPVINGQFNVVSFASGNVYRCFASMSYPEDFKIGRYTDGRIVLDKPPITSGQLTKDLQGICNESRCEEQPVCMGGCRLKAYVWAKRRGEVNPLVAGQDFCITKFLKEVVEE